MMDMKNYKIDYSDKVIKKLKKMDSGARKRIVAWIEKYLDGCNSPRYLGKPLTGDKKGLWSYRVGSYRLVAQIKDDEIIIFMVDIDHRSRVYSGTSLLSEVYSEYFSIPI